MAFSQSRRQILVLIKNLTRSRSRAYTKNVMTKLIGSVMDSEQKIVFIIESTITNQHQFCVKCLSANT